MQQKWRFINLFAPSCPVAGLFYVALTVGAIDYHTLAIDRTATTVALVAVIERCQFSSHATESLQFDRHCRNLSMLRLAPFLQLYLHGLLL
jgi:hypothetical protein